MEQTQARKNRFQLVIPNKNDLVLNLQNLDTGSVSLSETRQQTPKGPVYFGDNMMQFGAMTVSFIVSNDYKEWIQAFEWMTDYTKSATFNNDQYASVIIYDTNNNQVGTITFKELKPTDLEGIDFDVVEDETITKTLTLTYEGIKIDFIGRTVVQYGFDD